MASQADSNQGSVSVAVGWLAFHTEPWLLQDFLELNPGDTQLNHLDLPSHNSFHPLCLSSPMGILFVTFQVGKLGSHLWPDRIFLKPHLSYEIVEQPHYHPWNSCRRKLKLVDLLVKRRPPPHAGFDHVSAGAVTHYLHIPLPPAPPGFHVRKKLRSRSLGASCLFPWKVSHCLQPGCLGLCPQFDRVYIFQDVSLLPSLHLWMGNVIFMSRELSCFSFNSGCLTFLKTSSPEVLPSFQIRLSSWLIL